MSPIVLAAGDMRVVTPIKYLSIAMLVIPALGILRGYIQGYAFISYSAFSQVIEQIAVLLTCFMQLTPS
jgi:hypothetical protein